MSAKNKETASTADREITNTRVFDAPRELVWQAMTDPQHVIHWWGPRGFTTTIEEMDVRPGGIWKHVMHGPDGTDYPNKSIFVEVVKPERIVYSHGGAKKGGPGANFEATWTFDALEPNKTRVTVRMVFATAEERDLIAKVYGAIEGLQQTLDRLAEKLLSDDEVVITRSFNAPRELVFKAWTDSKHLAHWWGPKDFTNPVCEVDFRVGGHLHIDMRSPNGTIYPMKGVFREIVDQERLVLITSALDDKGVPMFEQLQTITFAREGDKTTLVVRMRVLNTIAEAAHYLKGYRAGMTQSLERLAELLPKI